MMDYLATYELLSRLNLSVDSIIDLLLGFVIGYEMVLWFQ
jgi:hypothetical protein